VQEGRLMDVAEDDILIRNTKWRQRIVSQNMKSQ
jgi:hypothetical protein